MTHHAFCSVSELDDGGHVIKQIGNREIAVFRIDGDYAAVANYCVHAGGPVCEGDLGGTTTGDPDDPWELGWDRDNEVLSCPWHGWEFDVFSGECLADDEFEVLTYDVELRDDQIFVVTG